MRQIISRIAPAGIFMCLATLALPSGIRAQNKAPKAYTANCVLCHAADGSGNSPSGKALGAKDLRSAEVQKRTDTALGEFITKGKGKMPAFGAKLSSDDIKQLVAYIRELPKKK